MQAVTSVMWECARAPNKIDFPRAKCAGKTARKSAFVFLWPSNGKCEKKKMGGQRSVRRTRDVHIRVDSNESRRGKPSRSVRGSAVVSIFRRRDGK